MENRPNQNEKVLCPICQQPVDPGYFAGPKDIEPAAAAYIRTKFDWWQEDMGLCPNCLQETLDHLLEAENQNLNPQLTTPVYGILPIGLRLGVDNRYDGHGVTIAFLDSGFSRHPDLAGRVKLYVDASNEELKELPQVETAGHLSWHGTMTSVVACGNGNLSNGLYRGLASGAELVLIKVSNSEGRIGEEEISRGLGWILTNGRRFGIQIVNISLGGDRPSDFANNPVDLMVEALIAQGILVVCAAGNAGERLLVPPASAPGAITVGGLDDKNTLDPTTFDLWHSNYGKTKGGVWKPEIVAPSIWLAAPVLPGSKVEEEAAVLKQLMDSSPEELAGLLFNSEIMGKTNLPSEIQNLPLDQLKPAIKQAWQSQKLITPHYQHVDGTSFAAPIVSSVAAQMLEAHPTLSPGGLKDLLMRTARYLPDVSPDQQGHGVVDPLSAVRAAIATAY